MYEWELIKTSLTLFCYVDAVEKSSLVLYSKNNNLKNV